MPLGRSLQAFPAMTGEKRHDRYQNYVIRDGALVGEFEEMYQDFDDPWEQTHREAGASEKHLAINLLRSHGARRVIELGCGLGGFSARMATAGMEVRGVDVSATAVGKARSLYPEIDFQVGDLLDVDLYRTFRPDTVVMAEITWYVLEKLGDFKALLSRELPGALFLHLLHTYAPGVQAYGRDYFTDLPGIMKYFGMEYLEWGTVGRPDYDGGCRTYFLARVPRVGS